MADEERDYPGVKIIRCSCAHKFQDQRYGKQMRLHNKNEKGFSCTVCKGDKVK